MRRAATLGSGKPIGEFYQIGSRLNTQGAQPGQPHLPGDLRALLGRLVAVELQQRERYLVEHPGHVVGAGIDEQARHGDERTGTAGQLGRAPGGDVAGLGG